MVYSPTQSCNYSVVVGMTSAAGNSQSTAATIEALQQWQPRYIFFVGVAGGLSGIIKGDVVVANIIHGYEYGKLDNGFIPRNDWTFFTDAGLRNGAAAFCSDQDWRRLIQTMPPQTCDTKVELGEIVSGDKVVDNTEDAFFQRVLSDHPKAKAVEMEGAGVGHAIEQARAKGKAIGFLMIRGISDLPRPKTEMLDTRGTQERDDWKPFAADAAAAFAIGYISNGLPVPPLQSYEVGYDSSNRSSYLSPKSAEVPREIPSPPADFVGRDDELSELLAHLDQGVAITGLPGIGKTAFAYKLADILENRYPDGLLKVDLQGTSEWPLIAKEAMAQIIRSFHPEVVLPKNDAELINRYTTIMNSKQAILLLDNAANDRQVRSLLSLKSCYIIITSRNQFTLPGIKMRRLNVLIPEKAVAFIKAIVATTRNLETIDCEDHNWYEIAELCGCLPLALRAAGSLLANQIDFNPATYAKELLDERTRLARIGREGVDLDVEASFNLSYARLPEETARVFRELAVFPTDFDPEAEEFVCLDENHRHLSELTKLSLIEYHNGARRYRFHDLIRVFAASRLSSTFQIIAQQRHAEHFLKVLTSAHAHYKQGGKNTMNGLKLFDLEWMNISKGHNYAKQIAAIKLEEAHPIELKQVIESALRLSKDYPNAGVRILGFRLHPEEWINWLDTALVAAHDLGDHNAEGVHLGNLGIAYSGLSEIHKSIQCYEQALTIHRETKNRHREGVVLGNLGNAYLSIGKPRKAIECHKQALSICREFGDNSGASVVLGNLGSAYGALGDVKRSIDYFEQHLATAHEIGDTQSEANATNNLGLAYLELDETQKAIEYFKKAIATYHELNDRRGEANVLGNLGIAYKKMDEIQKAIQHYVQQLKVARVIKDKRSMGNAFGNLGNAYEIRHKYTISISFHNKALQISREIGDPRSECLDLGNLGHAYFALGDNKKAIEFYCQSLVIARSVDYRLGEGKALWNLSLALDKLNQRPQAIDCAQKALQIFEQIESPKAEKVRQQLAEWQAPGLQET